MKTFAEKVITFNQNLLYNEELPMGIKIMNPFQENPEILHISGQFYRKFYSDTKPRKLILGINPGRLGAGATGIPFTDTKRLSEICQIKAESISTHEPSSVFIYDLISKYGGAGKFYSDYYINSVCPLGFIIKNERNNWINCNYYDYEELYECMKLFIINALQQQIKFGIDTSVCFVLGKKNAKHLSIINNEVRLFNKIIAFDHPRYIEQYKKQQSETYLNLYLKELQ